MDDFKKLPKMKCGGKVKKYETGGKVEAYQDSPDYRGMEDDSPAGKKAAAAADKAGYESENKLGAKAYRRSSEKEAPGWGAGVNIAAVKAAKNVIAKDRNQVKTMSNVDPMGNPLKKGGRVTKKVGTVKKNK